MVHLVLALQLELGIESKGLELIKHEFEGIADLNKIDFNVIAT